MNRTRFSATPKGILLDGVELGKDTSHQVPPHLMRYVNRAKKLLATVRQEEWYDRTPHELHNTPTLAKVKLLLAFAMPHYLGKDGYNPDEPRNDIGEWESEGDDSDDTGDSEPAESGNAWGNPDTLQKHFEDHGSDFGFSTPEEYANSAQEFLQNANNEGIQMKIDQNSNIRVYDPATNTFGAYNPDGTTRTYFKPTQGQDYFDSQRGEIVGGKPVNNPATTEAAAPESAPASSGRLGGGTSGAGGVRPENLINPDPLLENEERNLND